MVDSLVEPQAPPRLITQRKRTHERPKLLGERYKMGIPTGREQEKTANQEEQTKIDSLVTDLRKWNQKNGNRIEPTNFSVVNTTNNSNVSQKGDFIIATDPDLEALPTQELEHIRKPSRLFLEKTDRNEKIFISFSRDEYSLAKIKTSEGPEPEVIDYSFSGVLPTKEMPQSDAKIISTLLEEARRLTIQDLLIF